MMVMPVDIELSEKEIDACLHSQFLKVPAKTGIFKGARFSMPVKVGGRMQLVMVVCKDEPYINKFKNGKKALYVDVYGYGVSGAVNITRLREQDAEVKRG